MESTNVVICGCGPTGALLSVLLSQASVPHIVLEKDLEISSDPRGIALDEDGVRCLQACGIYDKIFTEIGQCMGEFKFISGNHNDLSRQPFMMMDYNTTEGGTGHPGFISHKQPSIEKLLRARIVEIGVASMRLGSRVTSIHEDDTSIYTTYTDASGVSRTVRSQLLVGADGKTGFVRKQYLEPKGIIMKPTGIPWEQDWVAMNWKITLPTPTSHPQFPLWAMGYTPQQVYDCYFPSDFRFLCNPTRAAVCGRFGLEEDRLWRFEFAVQDGEDAEAIAAPNMVRQLVHPYITHPGSRHGLPVDIPQIVYPLDCIQTLRCRPFHFSARSCNEWALGRAILCGDAAHVFPPFGGQGIASGFRDAIGLAWRLRIATDNSSLLPKPNHKELLQGWYRERKQQLDASLKSTVENGNYVTEPNPVKATIRDWSLWAMQCIPSWKHLQQLGNRRDGMTRYRWDGDGHMAFLPDIGGGRSFPQVYVAAAHASAPTDQSRVYFSDDVIFTASKVGLFQIVALMSPQTSMSDVAADLQGLRTLTGEYLSETEAAVIIDTLESLGAETESCGEHVYRLATAAEFVKERALSAGRPEPIGYNPRRIFEEFGTSKYVILRPDRFVFAVCSSRSQLMEAARQLLAFTKSGSVQI